MTAPMHIAASNAIESHTAKTSKNGRPTEMRSPSRASTTIGYAVPTSTTTANVASRRLFSRKTPSRLASESSGGR